MKQHFLDRLAESILSKHNEILGKICVVFPSRRAGLFFKKYLSERIDKPRWAPEILGIQDFIQKLSPFPIEDKTILTFELFEVYKKYVKDESFDKFYPWGNIILNDFDDIDKNLVNADGIFRIIKEHREMDSNFEITFGDFEEFEKFWRTFSSQNLSDRQKDFIQTWEILGKVYKDFRARLTEKKISYEGMAYRKIYENIRTNKIKLNWEKIIFAGFNALNKAEEGIIRELSSKSLAETYWDADEYYINDNKQEAGSFIRDNFRNLEIKNPEWLASSLTGSDDKKITVIGAPMQSGQVKALGNEIKKLNETAGTLGERSAIVLPDESMLIPLLHSIPEEIESFNVTMGYPLKDTPLYSLLELLKDLQKYKRGSKDKPVFYHKYVTGILMHPYIRQSFKRYSYEFTNRIRKRNIVYVSASTLNEQEEIGRSGIFTHAEGISGTIAYLFNVMNWCSEAFENSTSSTVKFDREYFHIFFTQLNRLSDILEKYPQDIETETFWKLLAEILFSVRIPFIGEPLKGLQIMGMLETRALDFDNVFILSANEGILPRGYSAGSFIPYHLRKAFRLQTYEDEDAISAYYFYRLIQKSKNIFLFYNTEPNDFGAGEKSRFIMQIENELAKNNPGICYEELIMDVPALVSRKKNIVIDKDEKVIDKLRDIKKYSATAILSYISCPLKFYLSRIAGLKEEEDIEEFFGGATFGNIFHGVMKVLYEDYTGKFVNEENLIKINKRLKNEFDSILMSAFELANREREFVSEMQGKNLLYKGILKKIAEKVLENDKNDLPFKIIELENNFDKDISVSVNGKNEEITLHGRIDRVDEAAGQIRIIDYKTGKVTAKKMNEDSFGFMFEDPTYKEYFQTYFYAMLYGASNPGKEVIPGIYPLRNIGEGIRYVSGGPVSETAITDFETGVKKILEELFDIEKPFVQTEDEYRCKFCDFKGICYRK